MPPISTRAAGPETRPDRFARRVLFVAAVAVGSVLLLAGLWYGARVFLLLFAGVLVGICLRALADTLSGRFGLSPRWAYGLVVGGILVLAVGGGWLLQGGVREQVRELSEKLPSTVERVREKFGDVPWTQQLLESETARRLWENGSSEAGSKVPVAATAFFGGVADLAVVLVIGFFVGLDSHRYREGLLRFVPPARRAWAGDALDEMKVDLRYWMLGMLVSTIYVGVLTAVGLWALGVPFALPLALLTALLCFIPFFGPILATIPAALVALATDNPYNALWVTLLYLAVQMSEGNIVTPLVQQRAIHSPPALTLAVVLLMGAWLGPLGMLLALPMTAVAWVLVRRLYLEGMLGEPPTGHEGVSAGQ